ncbi:MAG: hypothetical protein ACKVOJ_06780 [Sphingomonadaceae bacterium]
MFKLQLSGYFGCRWFRPTVTKMPEKIADWLIEGTQFNHGSFLLTQKKCRRFPGLRWRMREVNQHAKQARRLS